MNYKKEEEEESIYKHCRGKKKKEHRFPLIHASQHHLLYTI